MIRLLRRYNKVKQEIHDYFNYVESFDKIPIDDYTEFYYKYDKFNNKIFYSDKPENKDKEHYDYDFSDEVIDYYEGDDYIMFLIKNFNFEKYLNIFDKTKNIETIDEYNLVL